MTSAVWNSRTNGQAWRPRATTPAAAGPAAGPAGRFRPPVARAAFALLLLAAALAGAGCRTGATVVPADDRRPIDRSVVEFPAGLRFERFITGLRAPSAMAFDAQRNAILIAESGADGAEPRIIGFDFADESQFRVYPQGKQIFGFRSIPFKMYGPVGGMAVRDGMVYVAHRDKQGMGVVSVIDAEGKGKTVVAGLPAQGDYGVTDLAFHPTNGRLYFGVGAATNSGVVGLDNFQAGWVQRHRNFADRPYVDVRTRGSRFQTANPFSGLFTGSELALTGPYQPFGVSYRTLIDAPADGKPNAAIYSVAPTGGISDVDLRIEAHGIRHPAGLTFDPRYEQLYASNQGMELRGTRPVLNDPNVVLRIPSGPLYFGWPDFSADLYPITDQRYQPPPEMINSLRRTGYSEVTFQLDHGGGLRAPDPSYRDDYLRAVLPPLSGASKMTFLPDKGPLGEFPRQLAVALAGDRAPFATSGRRLKGPVGGKVVRVDVDSDQKIVRDFIRNTAGVPRSKARGNDPDMLERPIDVKVGPDGYLYVLDLGRMDVRGGKDRVRGHTGQVFRLRPSTEPTTQPAAADAVATPNP